VAPPRRPWELRPLSFLAVWQNYDEIFIHL